MEQEQEEELESLNWTALFLLLLIVAVLISFLATVEQRNGLIQALYCQQENATNVFSKRWTASALVVGATGFFAWLACRGANDARAQGDCTKQRSAHANLLAAVLVFVAALVRLNDLKAAACD